MGLRKFSPLQCGLAQLVNRICLVVIFLIAVPALFLVGQLSAYSDSGDSDSVLDKGSDYRSAPASNSTRRLQNAVHRLTASISDSDDPEYSSHWRRTLMLNILETQAALGEQADITTLNEIYSRFVSNADQFDDSNFEDASFAIRDQIEHLSSSYVADLFAAVTLARAQYRQIHPAEMAYQRDVAKYEIQRLFQHYRGTLPSNERANLFFDLELDDVISHLDEIKFELAPEISVGKMDSLIRGLSAQVDAIQNEIDAMPLESEDEDEEGEIELNEGDREIEIPFNLRSPEPDNGRRTADELEEELEKLESQLDELKSQRREIAEKDKPRQSERRKTFLQLRKFEDNFIKASKTQLDPYFVSAAASYERFVRSYFYGTSDNLQEDYLKRLEALEANLLEIDGPNSRTAAGELGDILRWLENANQIPHLVTAIRARYSNPNVYISFSSNLLNQVGSQSVNESRYIRQNVGGRLVRGTATTSAQVSVELQDDPNQINASIHLLGSVNSNTYVEQGKIRVFAGVGGQLEGRRSIFANIGGLYASDPEVAANMKSTFQGTNSCLKLVNKIAGQKFEEARASGERSSSCDAEEELLETFGGQTDEPIESGQAALNKAQNQFSANSARIPELYARSFPSEIMLVGKKSSISTIAAQGAPMPPNLTADVSVRLHDSMLSNLVDKTFSGKTFTDKELAGEIGAIFGQSPGSLAGDAEDKDADGEDADGEEKDESFSITFATVRPIQFEFENNGFRVVVSGRRFAQGDKRINEGLKISLRFRIKRIDGKLKFVRDGKAEIEYLDKDYTPKAVAFRSVLDGKLNPKEGADQISVDLPDNLLPVDSVEALKESDVANRLRLVQCRAEQGWLYLGWNYQPENSYPAWQYDVPAILNESTILKMQPAYLNADSSGGSTPIVAEDLPPVVSESIPAPAVSQVQAWNFSDQ